MNAKKIIWIEAGFSDFARYGPEHLKVDRIAGLVNKSRSSFYHLFGDLEGFRDALHEYYWEYTKRIASMLDEAEYFYPDFAVMLEENKDWAFTHMQLFHHRERCEKCGYYFKKGTELIEDKIGKLWAKTAGLDELPIQKTKYLYRVIREAIFSKLSYDTYSAELLDSEIKKLNESLEFLLTGVQS